MFTLQNPIGELVIPAYDATLVCSRLAAARASLAEQYVGVCSTA